MSGFGSQAEARICQAEPGPASAPSSPPALNAAAEAEAM